MSTESHQVLMTQLHLIEVAHKSLTGLHKHLLDNDRLVLVNDALITLKQLLKSTDRQIERSLTREVAAK